MEKIRAELVVGLVFQPEKGKAGLRKRVSTDATFASRRRKIAGHISPARRGASSALTMEREIDRRSEPLFREGRTGVNWIALDARGD